LRKSAVLREIEVIGEAIKQVPISITAKYPSIEWKVIAGARDKIIHHYFGIDIGMIWGITQKDLPYLKKEIKAILKAEKPSA
jgi:uncharacterized protein with HEPN domain